MGFASMTPFLIFLCPKPCNVIGFLLQPVAYSNQGIFSCEFIAEWLKHMQKINHRNDKGSPHVGPLSSLWCSLDTHLICKLSTSCWHHSFESFNWPHIDLPQKDLRELDPTTLCR